MTLHQPVIFTPCHYFINENEVFLSLSLWNEKGGEEEGFGWQHIFAMSVSRLPSAFFITLRSAFLF
jgi:hypothetical protein